MSMRAELNGAECNFPEVDFWPLIKSVRVVYACACYALFWSCVMWPVLLVLGYGITTRDVAGTSLFDLHANWRMPLVWLVSYAIGFLVSLPHVLWLARLERRSPGGRIAFMVRSMKIGLVYGVAQGIGVWLFAVWRTGHMLHYWPLGVAFYLVAFVCGYIAGRIEAKSVPIES